MNKQSTNITQELLEMLKAWLFLHDDSQRTSHDGYEIQAIHDPLPNTLTREIPSQKSKQLNKTNEMIVKTSWVGVS